MEATAVKIGGSLGVRVHETDIRNFNLKVVPKVEINFRRDEMLSKKSKVREGWDAAFLRYAEEGEDKLMMPDFLDTETDEML